MDSGGRVGCQIESIEAIEEGDRDRHPRIPSRIHCSPATVECSARPFCLFLLPSLTQLSQSHPERSNCHTTTSASAPHRLRLVHAYEKLSSIQFPSAAAGVGGEKNLPIDSQRKPERARLQCRAIEEAETSPNFSDLFHRIPGSELVLWPDTRESRSEVRLGQLQ
jgi:hypothetical protein